MTMKVFTVHQPPKLTGDAARDAERFVFVRDGFHFWAFILGPLWMLWRRMWLVLFLYVLAMTAIQIGLLALGASPIVSLAVDVLIALLVGFEAATLRRFTLRNWKTVGMVVARDREEAERRFFDAWVDRDESPRPAAASTPVPAMRRSPAASDEVVGLFPEPELRR
jgi:hypothetical protein